MNKKRRISIIVLLIICIIILCLLITMVFSNSTMTEKEIVNKLTNMGEVIYTQYYYPELSKGKSEKEFAEYLRNFEEKGLKFSLTELEKYSEDFKNSISKFRSKEKTCNKENTMVIIYPESPYTSTSFSTEIKLDCGFKK